MVGYEMLECHKLLPIAPFVIFKMFDLMCAVQFHKTTAAPTTGAVPLQVIRPLTETLSVESSAMDMFGAQISRKQKMGGKKALRNDISWEK